MAKIGMPSLLLESLRLLMTMWKRIHGATIVDAPLIYFNIHGIVKPARKNLYFPNLAQTGSYINGIISTNLGYLRLLNKFLFSEEKIHWIFRGIQFMFYIRSAYQIKIYVKINLRRKTEALTTWILTRM